MVTVHIFYHSQKERNVLTPLIPFLRKKYTVYVPSLDKDIPGPDFIIIAHVTRATQEYMKLFPNAITIHVDHGTSFLKNFMIHNYRVGKIPQVGRIRYVVSNEMILRLYRELKRIKRSDLIMGSYARFADHIRPPSTTKKKFMKTLGFKAKEKLILFAPTWVSKSRVDVCDDMSKTIKILGNIRGGKCITILHTEGAIPKSHKNVKVFRNAQMNIVDAMKHADIVVVDTSSILFEAAAHNKRIVQVLYSGYSNNSSTDYNLPAAAILGEPFYIGKITRPERVAETVDEVLKNPKLYDSEFMPVIKTIGAMSGTKSDHILKALDDMIALKEEDIVEEKCEEFTPEEYRTMLGYDKFVKKKEGRIGITFGTYDLLHIGHINIFKEAKKHCDFLMVGVSSDKLNFSKKKKKPVMTLKERIAAIEALDIADHVFVERSLDYKRHYIHKYQADVLFMGDDWKDKMQEYSDICEVQIFPRTKGISTSEILKRIK